jgi:hypothetical protein
MNPRERTLALVLGGFAALFVGKWLVVDVVWGPISLRETRLSKAMDDLEDKQDQLKDQKEAADALKKWKAASLPADPGEGNASVIYHGYLNDLLAAAGVKNANVTLNPPQVHKDSYTILKFSIDARCELAQLSKLLYEFERTDLMHAIRVIDLSPHVDTVRDRIEYVNAKLDGEVLAFKDAKPPEKLVPGGKKDDRKLAEFRYFAEKNFFQPTKIVDKDKARKEDRDDRSNVKFYGYTTENGKQEFLFSGSTIKLQNRLTVGDKLEFPGMKAKIVGYDSDNEEVQLEVDGKVGVVRSGHALSTWKETARKETSKKPAADKAKPQPIL